MTGTATVADRTLCMGQGPDGREVAIALQSDGTQKVYQAPPAPPAASTSAGRVQQTIIAAIADDFYVIPNGVVLTLQQLNAGAAIGNGGSKVELYEDATGTGTPLVLLAALYVDGSSDFVPLSRQLTGNGTRRVILRRTPLGGGSREVYGAWTGYEAAG